MKEFFKKAFVVGAGAALGVLAVYVGVLMLCSLFV